MAFSFEPMFQVGEDQTAYRCLTTDHVSAATFDGQTYLKIHPAGLTLLAKEAFSDIAFYLRTAHLKRLREELDDPEASDNDRFVIYTHLQNAVTAAAGLLPTCQDTGTAIVMGKKGRRVLSVGDDAEALSAGIYQTYQERNLRYSQIAPLEMFKEKNTGCNLPAQLDLLADTGAEHALEYSFLFIAKGARTSRISISRRPRY
jgi:fumarate hydratase class I